MMTTVFVYGSLMEGFANHRLLEGSEYIGTATTREANFTMISLGGFPGVLWEGNDIVVGELYEVDDETLAQLDRLEGHPKFYKREMVYVVRDVYCVPYEAQMYVLQKFRGKAPCVIGGDWRLYKEMEER